jgi:hypothetical protein
METNTTQPADSPPPEKRSVFDSIIISTPVLLTVVATFILGRSTSEMTQAQYQRAVASQKQSKVADEWAFFQAKRIRGTTLETTAVALQAQKTDLFTRESLEDASGALLREITFTEKDSPSLSEQLTPLAKEVQASQANIKNVLSPGSDKSAKPNALNNEGVSIAIAALKSYPRVKKEKSEDTSGISPQQRELLNSVLEDIKAFKSEKEIGTKALGLDAETVEKALDEAKANAAEVAKRGKQIDRVLEHFDALVDRQVGLAREYQRIVAKRLTVLANENGEKPASDEVTKLERRLDRVRVLSARLLTDYKAARFAFDARRYEDDARSNQDAAYIYDVQVFQSSAKSDKHLKRSFLFMIAMLVAQVGVTIASLAMMLKYRLPIWAIAAFSGIMAVGIGVAVFLELSPLLSFF